MALELDWRKCGDSKYVEALGFYMMFTSIGWELTERNADDFYVRVKLHEKLNGPIYHFPDKPFSVTPEIVQSAIGLKANVAPRTFLQFTMNLVNSVRSDLQREYRDAF